MGLVRRYDFGDGAARFELSPEDSDAHHHHLVCSRCARIVELDDCFLNEFQDQLARRHGFSQISHRMEFFGICPNCQVP
jgi:Fur family ferric uptake transcriptional regulator